MASMVRGNTQGRTGNRRSRFWVPIALDTPETPRRIVAQVEHGLFEAH
ncbi:hypothetical protein [Sporisorium scitamineum]|uniref:Uncharacterized protein n=1 Tax=Sporisorium scitamineum TaxID=49012 RepID=A0A0F7S1A2_9BASI|nr:hypothetical protein [Sporisorium scitamineum]